MLHEIYGANLSNIFVIKTSKIEPGASITHNATL